MRLSVSGSLLLLSLTLGCASSGAKPDDNPAPADNPPPAQGGEHPRARIENNSSLDMDIYVVRQSGPTRIGFVPANQSATFELPPGIVAGSAAVRFEARPVRGSGRPVGSEIFPINDGSEITWTIPAQ
ncbi:MAG TPA: hypothetical protein VM387_04310 [Gemmatimonadales bacterium]|jgi:hypothetical protein|nr:hypothetical protein [Gemmatimonadales bacterium]